MEVGLLWEWEGQREGQAQKPWEGSWDLCSKPLSAWAQQIISAADAASGFSDWRKYPVWSNT